jgi:hypothetical protein
VASALDEFVTEQPAEPKQQQANHQQQPQSSATDRTLYDSTASTGTDVLATLLNSLPQGIDLNTLAAVLAAQQQVQQDQQQQHGLQQNTVVWPSTLYQVQQQPQGSQFMGYDLLTHQGYNMGYNMGLNMSPVSTLSEGQMQAALVEQQQRNAQEGSHQVPPPGSVFLPSHLILKAAGDEAYTLMTSGTGGQAMQQQHLVSGSRRLTP